jgi:hypothetical protein
MRKLKLIKIEFVSERERKIAGTKAEPNADFRLRNHQLLEDT